MARLILSLDGQVMAEYNMNKERYTVGRLPDNDIRIDNPAVSGHHSLIINILNDSFLEDLNSTNGTYVNGKLIKKHALQHGDVVTVGHHQLRFVDTQSADAEPDEFEKTMVITPGSAVAAAAAKKAQAIAPAPPRPPKPSATGATDGHSSCAHERDGRASGRAAEGEAAGVERRVCGPRTGTEQGADDARAPGRAGRRHHATRRRLLHRARRQRQAERLSARSTARRSASRPASCRTTT